VVRPSAHPRARAIAISNSYVYCFYFGPEITRHQIIFLVKGTEEYIWFQPWRLTVCFNQFPFYLLHWIHETPHIQWCLKTIRKNSTTLVKRKRPSRWLRCWYIREPLHPNTEQKDGRYFAERWIDWITEVA
jgi:hypothetical protein